MKHAYRFQPLLLGLTFGALSVVAHAQQTILQAPGTPPLTPGLEAPRGVPVIPSAPEKAGGTIERFTISDLNLFEAISALQGQLRNLDLPRLNILLPPGAENVPVPPIDLYNVTGSDALILIAAASGVEAKPIMAEDGAQSAGRGTAKPKVIGYRIEKKEQKVVPGMAAAMGRTMAADVDVQEPPKKEPAKPEPEKPTLRVYPLNPIIKGGPIEQIRLSLEEILNLSGADPNQVKVSFHDRTNLLIVRAPESVHRTVAELLSALEKNALPVPLPELPSPTAPTPPETRNERATAPVEQH